MSKIFENGYIVLKINYQSVLRFLIFLTHVVFVLAPCLHYT